VVKVATTSLGQILVDGAGRTLYLFEADKGATSSCYSSCAALWPPLLTHGAPAAAAGAQMSLVATTTRTDGSAQVTYAGHPLYYWVADKNAGQTSGQAVNNSGGVWYVVAVDGSAVTKAG